MRNCDHLTCKYVFPDLVYKYLRFFLFSARFTQTQRLETMNLRSTREAHALIQS